MKNILKVDTPNDYARFVEAPELHPLVSIIHYDELAPFRHSLNNYSIGGSISLNQDPVVPLTDEQASHLLDDLHRIHDRMGDLHLQFYHELMGSLCLTMIYDIFDAHAQRETTDTHTDRTAYIVKQLMALLATGISRTERDVSYYAGSWR